MEEILVFAQEKAMAYTSAWQVVLFMNEDSGLCHVSVTGFYPTSRK
ncbi:MAG: hypothetical protein FWH42_01510 [Dehalococcoidia bacterium]|nr:hypothetical protein [Dehalococcoidia bacterium]